MLVRVLRMVVLLALIETSRALLIGASASGALLAAQQEPQGVSAVPNLQQAVTGAVTPCRGGKAKGFDCESVDLLAFLPPSAVGAVEPVMLGDARAYFNSIWGWTDSGTQRQFVLLGRVDGVSFVEITDPIHPIYLGYLPLHAGSSALPWRDVKVYKNHAFIIADISLSHGMQVFDLTQLRTVKQPPVMFEETAHYDGFGSAHTLALDEATGYAYAAGGTLGGGGCGGGLHVVDVRTPTEPAFVGCYTEPRLGGSNGPGYIHEAQCTLYHGPDRTYHGREICLNAAETALGIADVTDKQEPKTISIATYPNVGYTHQGWLTEDQRYFFLNDELDDGAGGVNKTRTIVFDLNDLDDPVVLTEFHGPTSASDHNLYVRGRYIYQSNYAAGLRVIDIADPAHPKEVGYFDTYPDAGRNAPGFVGSWSNFPYFKSDDDGVVVAVSSIAEGLFLVRFRPSKP